MTVSKTEQNISRSLSSILADLPNGASIPESEQFRDVLSSLEWFLTAVLREIHPEWEYEHLDAIFPLIARKNGEAEVEIFGECVLISDSTLVPVQICLQLSLSGDAIPWLELNLGEIGEGGMTRSRRESHNKLLAKLYALSEGGADAIDWAYRITFGERRP